MALEFFEKVEQLLPVLKQEEVNMRKAGHIVAQSIMSGGILQAFGSGHSASVAIEICGRAGGLIPSKQVKELSGGQYERIEGVGTIFAEMWDIRKNDCLFIISNSGRNPLTIEMAMHAQSVGVPIVAVTALDVGKHSTSRHSSGRMLWQLADVILDNHSIEGDATIELPGLPTKIAGTSSISSDILVDQSIVFAIREMLDAGYVAPVFMSTNVDGGLELNKECVAKYANRLYHV
jgi:uncharacterized phosphosugar-binding protein